MKKLIPALCLLLISAVLMGTSTYAWFSMNTEVTATGMTVRTKVGNNLFIADASGSSFTIEGADWQSNFIGNIDKLIEPVSTIDGTSFYYTSGTNVQSSGAASQAKYTKVTGDGAADTAFNENYGIASAASEKASAYADYKLALKATNTSDADMYLNMTKAVVSYLNDDTPKAFRVALLVQDCDDENAVISILNTKSVLSGGTYFKSAAKAYRIVGNTALTEVSGKDYFTYTTAAGDTLYAVLKATATTKTVADVASWYTACTDDVLSGDVTAQVTVVSDAKELNYFDATNSKYNVMTGTEFGTAITNAEGKTLNPLTIDGVVIYSDNATLGAADAKWYSDIEMKNEITDKVTVLSAAPTDITKTSSLAVSGVNTLDTVVNLGKNAMVGIVPAETTRYFVATVRLWLEGEDTTCNNDTFAELTDKWALDLDFALADAEGGATTLTEVEKTTAIKVAYDAKYTSTMEISGTVYYIYDDANKYASTDAALTKDSRFFKIGNTSNPNAVYEVTYRVIFTDTADNFTVGTQDTDNKEFYAVTNANFAEFLGIDLYQLGDTATAAGTKLYEKTTDNKFVEITNVEILAAG